MEQVNISGEIDAFANFRDEQGNIDLFGFYQTMHAAGNAGMNMLQYTMQIQPIKSREVAALAIATASQIDQNDR